MKDHWHGLQGMAGLSLCLMGAARESGRREASTCLAGPLFWACSPRISERQTLLPPFYRWGSKFQVMLWLPRDCFVSTYYVSVSRTKTALPLCRAIRWDQSWSSRQWGRWGSERPTTHPRSPGTSILPWRDEDAFWGRAELLGPGLPGLRCMFIPPRTLGPGPHTPHLSSLPAAAPAPAGPPTVTDYHRDPGDRGGHIWILLQGLAGGLGGGGAKAAERRA